MTSAEKLAREIAEKLYQSTDYRNAAVGIIVPILQRALKAAVEQEVSGVGSDEEGDEEDTHANCAGCDKCEEKEE